MKEVLDKDVEHMVTTSKKISCICKNFTPYLECLGRNLDPETLFPGFLLERKEHLIMKERKRSHMGV